MVTLRWVMCVCTHTRPIWPLIRLSIPLSTHRCTFCVKYYMVLFELRYPYAYKGMQFFKWSLQNCRCVCYSLPETAKKTFEISSFFLRSFKGCDVFKLKKKWLNGRISLSTLLRFCLFWFFCFYFFCICEFFIYN